MTQLQTLINEIAEINKANGWEFEIPREIPKLLMLCVSELAEAMEADRKSRKADIEAFRNACGQGLSQKEAFEKHIKDTYEDELADAVIRVFDLCQRCGVDIETHIRLKLFYNKTRGFHHGNKKY